MNCEYDIHSVPSVVGKESCNKMEIALLLFFYTLGCTVPIITIIIIIIRT